MDSSAVQTLVVGTVPDTNLESPDCANNVKHGVSDAANDTTYAKSKCNGFQEPQSDAASAELPVQGAANTNHQDDSAEVSWHCLCVHTFDPALGLVQLEKVRGDCTMRMLTNCILEKLKINEARGMFAVCEERPKSAMDSNAFAYTPTYEILDMTAKVRDLDHLITPMQAEAARSNSVAENFRGCFGGVLETANRMVLRLCVPLFAQSLSKSFDWKALNNLCTFDLPAAEYYFWQMQCDLCMMLQRICHARHRQKSVWHPSDSRLLQLVECEAKVYHVILRRRNEKKRTQRLVSFATRRYKELFSSNSSTSCNMNFNLNYRIDQNYLSGVVKNIEESSKVTPQQTLELYFNELTNLVSECDKSKVDLLRESAVTRPWPHQFAEQSVTDDCVEKLSIADLNCVQLDSSHYLSVTIHDNELWLVTCGFDSHTSTSIPNEQLTKKRVWSKVPLCPVRNAVVWCCVRRNSNTLVLYLVYNFLEISVQRDRLDAVYSWVHQVLHVYDDPSPNSCPCLLSSRINNGPHKQPHMNVNVNVNDPLHSPGRSATAVEGRFNSQDNAANLYEWPCAEQSAGSACGTGEHLKSVHSNPPNKDAHLIALKSLDRPGDYTTFACDHLDLRYHVYWLAPSGRASGQLWLFRATLQYDPFQSAMFHLSGVERLHLLRDKSEPRKVPSRCASATVSADSARKEVNDERDRAAIDSDFMPVELHDCFRKSFKTFTDFENCLKEYVKQNDADGALRSKLPPDRIKSRRSIIIAIRPNPNKRSTVALSHQSQVKLLDGNSDAAHARRHVRERELTAVINVDYQPNGTQSRSDTVVLKQIKDCGNQLQLCGFMGYRVQNALTRALSFSMKLGNFPGLSRLLSVVIAHQVDIDRQSLLYKMELGNLHAVVENHNKQRSGFPFSSAHLLQVGLQLSDTFLYLRTHRIVHGSFHLGNVLVSSISQHSIQVRLAEPGINHIYYEDAEGKPTSHLFKLYRLLSRNERLLQSTIADVMATTTSRLSDVSQETDAYEKLMFVQFLLIRKYIENSYNFATVLPQRNVLKDHEILMPLLRDFYIVLIGLYMLNFYGRSPESGDLFKLNEDSFDNSLASSSAIQSLQMPSITSDNRVESDSLPDFRKRLSSLVSMYGLEFSEYYKALRILLVQDEFLDTEADQQARLHFKKSLWLIDDVYRKLRELYKEFAIEKSPFAVVPADINQWLTSKLPFHDVESWIIKQSDIDSGSTTSGSSTSASLQTNFSGYETITTTYIVPASYLHINERIGAGCHGTVFHGNFSVAKFLHRRRDHLRISLNEDQFVRQTHFWQYIAVLSCSSDVGKLSELPEGAEQDGLLSKLTSDTRREALSSLLPVAMKFFKTRLNEQPADWEAAMVDKHCQEQERRIQETLTHPRILPIIGVAPRFGEGDFKTYRKLTGNENWLKFYADFFRDNGTQEVCILPYCLSSVQRHLHASGESNMEMLLSIAVCVLDGLIYLRQNKVLHGDIATRNVLITSLRKPYAAVIGDFSLAEKMDVSGEMICKKLLCSLISPPEALNGHFYLEKTDIWGFGTFLWEMLTLSKVTLDEAYKHQTHSSRHTQSERMFDSLVAKAVDAVDMVLKAGIRLPDPINVFTEAEWKRCKSKCGFKIDFSYPTKFCEIYQTHRSKLYDQVLIPCWQFEQHNRPTYELCKENLQFVLKQIQ